MRNYLELANRLAEIFDKCKYEEANRKILKMNQCENLAVGIIGVNITEHDQFLHYLKERCPNFTFADLNQSDEYYFDCDVIIQVIDAVQPVSRGDYELYKRLSIYNKFILFSISRLEYIDEDELESLKDYIESKLNSFNKNSKIYYLKNKTESVELYEHLNSFEADMKNDSIKYKLYNVCLESLNYIEKQIYDLENWETQKSKQIGKIEDEINKYISYGEGFALFIERQREEYEKYLAQNGTNDKKHVESYFNNLITAIDAGLRKYVDYSCNDLKKINAFGIEIFEELRTYINSYLHRNIEEANLKISEINKREKDMNYLSTLKEGFNNIKNIEGELNDA
ncbi:hypothetical protein HMPREF1982_03095 [Clostridiales bacterium oral taxon 876 str. F0540]|nr:hypothetical protein HMPREF1982_03095 [Clostridiales bacterium oral taxon 876 str. F0540]